MAIGVPNAHTRAYTVCCTVNCIDIFLTTCLLVLLPQSVLVGLVWIFLAKDKLAICPLSRPPFFSSFIFAQGEIFFLRVKERSRLCPSADKQMISQSLNCKQKTNSKRKQSPFSFARLCNFVNRVIRQFCSCVAFKNTFSNFVNIQCFNKCIYRLQVMQIKKFSCA